MLVTHDMATVQGFCDRAMLLHDGELRYIGDPEEAALRYYRLNFARRRRTRSGGGGVPDVNVRVVDAWLEDAARRAGRERRAGRADRPRRRVRGPPRPRRARSSASTSSTPTARRCSASTARSTARRPGRAGRRARIAGTIENPLAARALLRQLLDRRATATQGDLALHVLRLLDSSSTARGRARATSSVRADVEAGRASRAVSEPRALELREVRGPSALGGGWRRALELLYLIAVTEFSAPTSGRRSATCGRSRGR